MNQPGEKRRRDAKKDAREARIRALKERLADLQARWPKHSVPPAMLQELEEIEDQLSRLEHD